jgi:hypothetical protein
VVTICTTNLTFRNSIFRPHSVFMRFVWISEPTAIIFLYSINWLVFITEMESVYCAVRTEYLNVIQVNFRLLVGAMTQVVSRRSLTVDSPPVGTWLCPSDGGGRSDPGTGFCPSTSVFPGSETRPMPHTHLHLHIALKQKDKWAKHGNVSKSSVLSEMEERCIEPLFCSLRNRIEWVGKVLWVGSHIILRKQMSVALRKTTTNVR